MRIARLVSVHNGPTFSLTASRILAASLLISLAVSQVLPSSGILLLISLWIPSAAPDAIDSPALLILLLIECRALPTGPLSLSAPFISSSKKSPMPLSYLSSIESMSVSNLASLLGSFLAIVDYSLGSGI